MPFKKELNLPKFHYKVRLKPQWTVDQSPSFVTHENLLITELKILKSDGTCVIWAQVHLILIQNEVFLCMDKCNVHSWKGYIWTEP